MIPGKGTSLPHHIKKTNNTSSGFSVLKSALIYGPNASGKSNLIKAVGFAQWFVRRGRRKGQYIPITPFRLDANTQSAPSRFEFEFQVEDKYYAYGFIITGEKVQEEWLFQLKKKSEKSLFERKATGTGEIEVDFSQLSSLQGSAKTRVEFIALDTLPNELFLTALNQRNIEDIAGIEPFIHAYTWITQHLHVVFPHTTYEGIEVELQNDQEFADTFSRFLSHFNTGIHQVIPIELEWDNPAIDIPDEIRNELLEVLEAGDRIIISSPNGLRYVVRRNEVGEILAVKLMTQHKITGSEEMALFDINEESDGTQRIIDLIPILSDLEREESVVLIDELDRSLHPTLTYQLIDLFHNKDQPAKGQLIVTTHESGLLDLNLLRKDEIWFVEKNTEGASELYSLEEFKPRRDKEIRRGYLQGRYGAIPVFQMNKSLSKLISPAP